MPSMVRLSSSADREFLDGLVTKVYEFGGGRVREHLGGIYDFLQSRKIEELNQLGSQNPPSPQPSQKSSSPQNPQSTQKNSYAEHKEQQKQLRKAERAVEESERKIARMEQRLKELDDLLMKPENVSDMILVTEYTTIKKALDEEMERWEQLSEAMDKLG